MSNHHYFVVIEGEYIRSYALDDRSEWRIGRPTIDNTPDIPLHTPTISRHHGRLRRNRRGYWLYVDEFGKNGTLYNNEPVVRDLRGKCAPMMLEDKDVFLFGSAGENVLTGRTVYAMFTDCPNADSWSVRDTKGCRRLIVDDGESKDRIDRPLKGQIIRKDKGIAIYMGNTTYVAGEVDAWGVE